jgi:hypothetical protein
MTDAPTQVGPLLPGELQHLALALTRLKFAQNYHVQRMEAIENSTRRTQYDLKALIWERASKLELRGGRSAQRLQVVEEVTEFEFLVVAHVGSRVLRFVEIRFEERLEGSAFPNETHLEPKEGRSLFDFAACGDGPYEAGDDDAPDTTSHDGYHTMEDDFPDLRGHTAFVVVVVVVFDREGVGVESREVVREKNEAAHGSFAFADNDVETQQGHEPAEKAEEEWAVVGCNPCRNCKTGAQAGPGESLESSCVRCSDGLMVSLAMPHGTGFARLLYVPSNTPACKITNPIRHASDRRGRVLVQ